MVGFYSIAMFILSRGSVEGKLMRERAYLRVYNI